MTKRARFQTVLAKVRDALPTLVLQSYIPIKASNGTMFRITAAHAKQASINDLVVADYVNMAHSALGDQFSLVPGSLEVVGLTNHSLVVSGIITANTISKEVTAKDLRKGYKLVHANVFMDDEDKIWKMIGEGENRRLVQAIQEDLNKILESRLARKSSEIVAGSVAHYQGVVPERGDYAVYYSALANDYAYGYAVVAQGDIYVAPRDSADIEKIEAAQVIDCIESSSLPEDKQDTKVLAMMFGTQKATSGNFSSDLAKEYLNYQRQLYADTPFFTKLEELIAKRRNFADLNLPLSTSEI